MQKREFASAQLLQPSLAHRVLPATWSTGALVSVVALALTGVLLTVEDDILSLRRDDIVEPRWLI